MAIKITKKTSTHNTTYSANRKPQWIVLHYTAGVSSASGKASAVASMFSTTTREASADFIVDDANIVQYNPDIKNRYCWAVGGSKYTSMSTNIGGKYYGVCTNKNSISIEMCSNKKNTSTLNATDTDWYLTDATVNNAVELTKYLMSLYNIDINHVITHHHVTGKLCPQPWCRIQSSLSGWNNFLAKVKGTSTTTTPATSTTTSTPASTTSKSTGDPGIVFTYAVRAGGKTYPAVTNLNDYAGVRGKKITDVAIKANKGSVKYRVHVLGGGWLPYVTGYNWNDGNNGYAGNGKAIDAIEVYYTTPADIAKKYGYQKAQYRVSPVNGNYYSWQYDNEKTNGQDGYAGDFGKAIDRFQLC